MARRTIEMEVKKQIGILKCLGYGKKTIARELGLFTIFAPAGAGFGFAGLRFACRGTHTLLRTPKLQRRSPLHY